MTIERKFRLLDLFCGAGGCSMGYYRAGFEVVGVDIHAQPRYPFEFHQADAMTYPLDGFDVIHASPPCQAYSITRHIHPENKYPDLVDKTRVRLEKSNAYWVIENVNGAPLRVVGMLCGLMFGLKVLRHRYFECSFGCLFPLHPKHPKGNLTHCSNGYSGISSEFVCVAGHNYKKTAGARAMGIDWMNSRKELSQAIPPAYTEYIGRQLMEILKKKGKVA
jgi:DNA (cytosine-5)-methyltransferase 1